MESGNRQESGHGPIFAQRPPSSPSLPRQSCLLSFLYLPLWVSDELPLCQQWCPYLLCSFVCIFSCAKYRQSFYLPLHFLSHCAPCILGDCPPWKNSIIAKCVSFQMVFCLLPALDASSLVLRLSPLKLSCVKCLCSTSVSHMWLCREFHGCVLSRPLPLGHVLLQCASAG